MKSRDDKGRFKKNEVEEPEFAIKLPSLKVSAYYAVLLLIFLPWLIIISKLKLTEKNQYLTQFYMDLTEKMKKLLKLGKRMVYFINNVI